MLRATGGALLAIVEHLGGGETDPRAQAGEKAVALRQLVERGERVAPEQAERAAVGLDRIIGEAAVERVEEAEADAPQAAFRAGAPNGAHHIGALAPRGDERGDRFGRVLQIGVHRDRGIGAERGGAGGLETEVARELDELETRVTGGLGGDEARGVVTTAVVDQDSAPGAIGCAVEQRSEAREQLGQNGLFVKDGNDDGEKRGRAGGGHG